MTGVVPSLRAGERLAKHRRHLTVIGSPSLNATRRGMVAAVSADQAARLAADAGSSGAVGTSSGIARGPAW